MEIETRVLARDSKRITIVETIPNKSKALFLLKIDFEFDVHVFLVLCTDF